MRFGVGCVLIVLAVLAAPAWASAADDLQLRRVMLSTGGVGYFEHEAVVEGDAVLSLEVRLDQVDDVLKSIVVYDDQGGVGTISLPGREPLGQLFRDLPFGPDALASPVALLNALQGAEVEVKGARALKGRVLRAVAEAVRLPNGGGTVTRHRVSLMTARGLQQFILEESDTLTFADPELQTQIADALAEIASHRVQDNRTLRIESTGKGRRTVRVAYVIGAPLWKATYRLIVPREEAAEKGHLQGWGVLENMGPEDWKDVDLTLVSGNPVTFRQALYTAYYVNRPEVPVEVLGRVLPSPDQGVVAGAREQSGLYDEKGLGDEEKARPESELAEVAGFAQPAPMAQEYRSTETGAGISPPPKSMASFDIALSEEAATQVAFHVPAPVSVAAGDSILVPIINRDLPAKRVGHYQPETISNYPLAAVRLTNDGETGLPPGVITLYERDAEGTAAHVGDARLATLPVGEERLVAFAVDQKTHIDRETESSQVISGGSISKGVFHLKLIERQTTFYRLRAPAQERRTVILDHARVPGWELVTPKENGVALTDDYYRLEIDLEPESEREVPVVIEHTITQQIGLGSLALPQLVQFASTTKLGQELRDAFERLADLRRKVENIDSRIADLQRQRDVIYQEQVRIRDNMGRVPRDSDLFRRYLEKFDRQETEVESIIESIDQAQEQRSQAQGRLDEAIQALEI